MWWSRIHAGIMTLSASCLRLFCPTSCNQWHRFVSPPKVGVPSKNELLGLPSSDGKSPGATLIPWARRKYVTWDATTIDTHVQSDLHLICGHSKKCSTKKTLNTLAFLPHKNSYQLHMKQWSNQHRRQQIHLIFYWSMTDTGNRSDRDILLIPTSFNRYTMIQPCIQKNLFIKE